MKPHERAVVEDAQQAIEDHSPVDVSEVEQLEDLVQRYA